MNAGEEQSEEQQESGEVDMLARQAQVGGGHDGAQNVPGEPVIPDLLADAELKGIMAQFNPMASKDITLIEKGVENFFLFHQAHYALTREDQLAHLGAAELDLLADRRALVRFQFLQVHEDTGQLVLRRVLIRPASLKGEQVGKVRRACIRGSAMAVAEFVFRRDRELRQMQEEGELAACVSKRFMQSGGESEEINPRNKADLKHLLAGLPNLSIESLLTEETGLDDDLLAPTLAILRRPSAEILAELQLIGGGPSEGAVTALSLRGNLPFLIELGRDFHLIQPAAGDLIQLSDSKVEEQKAETEWIYMLFVQLARQLLMHLLPSEETGWIQPRGYTQDKQYLEELQKHPSFEHGEDWEGAGLFLEAYQKLMKHVRSVRKVRREYLIDLMTQDSINKLNMQFEPVYFSPSRFELPDAAIENYIKKSDLYKAVLERMEADPEVLSYKEQREATGPAGTYFIYRANMPRAFIDNKGRRSFLHLFCKQNDMPRGIYDLLRAVDDSSAPRKLVDEQIGLSKAIREWEDEIEKERLKQERRKLGFFGRLLAFLRSLFGGNESPTRRSDDVPSVQRKPREKKARKTGVIAGPRERQEVIPGRVQKAIDYVDRNFRGIIWLDEVLSALGTVRYNENQIGDMLFYDKENRYIEVKALLAIRRVFLYRSREQDEAWIQSTIDYLENVTPQREEHRELAHHLRQTLRELK